MRRRLAELEARRLPRGRRDLLRQLALFVGAYLLYQLVRGLVDGNDVPRATLDATRVIDLERTLHVFVEPRIQAWANGVHWLMELADWTYLNAHYVVTIGVLAYIYLRRNASFYCVRNMFMVAMAFALVGYAVYPTAPPRLMPQWGFTDSIRQFTGLTVEHGPTSALLNLYAAIPSMHVCFALLTGGSMARLCQRRVARLAWRAYPACIAFVVLATANHYLIDVILGALTAVASARLAERLLARMRPDAWTFGQAAA